MRPGEATAELRAEIDSVLAGWAWHIDHGEFDGLAGLFTEDAHLSTGPVELHGRPQIRRRYADRTGVRTTRHLYSGVLLSDVSPGSVRARSTWACYAANQPAPVDEAAIYLVADFHDVLRRCPNRRLRDLLTEELVMLQAAGGPASPDWAALACAVQEHARLMQPARSCPGSSEISRLLRTHWQACC